jgi:hypothetical protein
VGNESKTNVVRFRGEVDDTGQAVTVAVPRKRKRKRGWRDHVSLMDVGLMSQLELNGTEHRVLMAVMASVPERGGADARCSLTDIATSLGIAVSSVSRAMKELRDRNIVLKTSNRIGHYRVNTWLAYNGDFDSWATEVEKDPEPKWRRDGTHPGTGEVE